MKTRHIVTLLAVMFLACNLHAQVGINTQNPDSSAILHIFHESKGVLLPTVNKERRHNETSNNNSVAEGLLVYDKDQHLFYFRDNQSGKWIALNPWRISDSTNVAIDKWNDVRLAKEYRNRNVYIGSDTNVVAAAKLHVGGTFQADKLFSAKQGANITGKTSITGSASVSDTVTAKHFVGYGTTPLGGIIMWSGTNVPDGWALCDGTNGTPDLRGRFIVGYDPGDADYNNPGDRSEKGNSIGKMGGAKRVTLTIDEMPKHYHGLNINYGLSRHSDSGTDYTPAQYIGKDLATVHWTGTTNEEGKSQSHENRPPYYALAFIMRVK